MKNSQEKISTTITTATTTTTTSTSTTTITTTSTTTTSTTSTTTSTTSTETTTGRVNTNTKWKQNGIIRAGGRGYGSELYQLNQPNGIDIDDDGSVYITDHYNHRVVKWILDANYGEVVAGGNGPGDRMNQIFFPTDVVIDKKTNSLIICDVGNNRVVRWSLENPKNPQIIVSEIVCGGLALDNNGDLYVSESISNEVLRWKQGAEQREVVAGGNGKENDFNQLSSPSNLWVDQDHSVYVTDPENHRVMKWLKDAKEGIVVAGGHGEGIISIN